MADLFSNELGEKPASESETPVAESEIKISNESHIVANVCSEKHNESFKVPVSFVPKQKAQRTTHDADISDNVEQAFVENQKSEAKKHKTVLPVPYQEPDWGNTPPAAYSLEVLKNGQIVSNIDLCGKSFWVFGRMENCNIVMEHPSVSRYHAVLQYRESGEKGYYVYDLESTHGTFLNKEQLRPRTYYKMHVGHMIKLGGSTRVYILQGPEEDEEAEDELSVTELKAKRRALEEEAAAGAKVEKQATEDVGTSEGIDWGFGEDAIEDPIAENPFAVSAPNEDLYLEDPKKTLRGWFEREGYELEYKVEEKGFGHFLCRIELPIDSTNGEAVFAEASVKGKKKEAVIAAALEACRILDRHGVLRQSQHDSRKRKEKDWESQDFYDSEEDTYLDRTGTIERKRQFRKKMVKKDDDENVETYDSLMAKLKETENEIAEVQKSLEQASKTEKHSAEENGDQDSLEAFMANLKNMPSVDKKAKSQLNLQLSVLMQERLNLQKLVKIAQPTALPPLQTTPIKCPAEAQKSLMKKLMPMTGAIRGKVIGKGSKILKTKPVDVEKQTKLDQNDKDEEVEEEQEDTNDVSEVDDSVATSHDILKDKLPASETASKETQKEDTDRALGSNLDVCQDNTANKSAVLGSASSPKENAREEKRKRQRKPNHRKAKLDSMNPDYSTWLPPDNQTGDGKTYLNDKFGY